MKTKIKKRGSPPLGGGEVLFVCPVVKQVKTLNFVEPGKVKRIRGIAYVNSIPLCTRTLRIRSADTQSALALNFPIA